MIYLSSLLVVLLLVLTSNQACALEVRNLRMGQDGRKAYLQYDLTGKPGEKEAQVIVSIEINGERYSSQKLTLSGDLGQKVKVGIRKRIWWDLLKDMPAGYDGEVVWNLDASQTNEQLVQIQAAKERDEQRERSQQLIKAPPITTQPAQVAALPKSLPEHAQPAAHSPLTEEIVFKSTSQVVIDVKHGLMWAKLGADTSEKFTYDKALSYVKKMNQEKFSGFDNWRLPDDEDVSKLFTSVTAIKAKRDKSPLKILLQYFPNLEDWHYWQDFPASRKYGKGANYKRSFDIENGTHTGDLESDGLCLLPVRTAAPYTPKPGKEQPK